MNHGGYAAAAARYGGDERQGWFKPKNELKPSDKLKLHSRIWQGCSKQHRKETGKSQPPWNRSKELARSRRRISHSLSMAKSTDGENGSECLEVCLDDSLAEQ